jgi:3-oxoacyl-[acyl-carrier-protein] synthase-3
MDVFIVGSGVSVPDQIVTNDELSRTLGLDAEYIFKMSGIRRRRWASPESKTSDFAASAIQNALNDVPIPPEEIDYLFIGTMTPDRFIPGCSTAVQQLLSLRMIPCLDIRATCCNTLYAMQLSSALITSGIAKNIAAGFSEIQSRSLSLTRNDAKTSMLFGDGASALIISSQPKQKSIRLVDFAIASDGAHVDDLGIRSPGTEFKDVDSEENCRVRMNGQKVIAHSVRKLGDTCKNLLEKNEVSPSAISWIVPHQANSNLLRLLCQGLEIPQERLVLAIEEYGNTSSASMGIAIDTLRKKHSAVKGDWVLLPAFGAGFTWGAALGQIV